MSKRTIRNPAVGSDAFAVKARRRPPHADPHLLIGPKVRCATWDEALAAVRAKWPTAYGSGSVGAWLFWEQRGTPLHEAVGEAWPVAGRADRGWWVRVLTPDGEAT